MSDQIILPYLKVYDDLKFKRRCLEAGYIIDDEFHSVRKTLIDLEATLKEKVIRDELIKLGWTPPEDGV